MADPACKTCGSPADAEVVMTGLGFDRAVYACRRHVEVNQTAAAEVTYSFEWLRAHGASIGIYWLAEDRWDHLGPIRATEPGDPS